MAEETDMLGLENDGMFDLDGAMSDVGMTEQNTKIEELANDPNTGNRMAGPCRLHHRCSAK